MRLFRHLLYSSQLKEVRLEAKFEARGSIEARLSIETVCNLGLSDCEATVQK